MRGVRSGKSGSNRAGDEKKSRLKRKRRPVSPPAAAVGFRPGSCNPGRFPIGPRQGEPWRFPIRVLVEANFDDFPFAVPLPEGSGSAGLRRKWVRHRVSPLPRASSPVAPPPLSTASIPKDFRRFWRWQRPGASIRFRFATPDRVIARCAGPAESARPGGLWIKRITWIT